MAKTTAKTNPDTIIEISVSEIFTKVFGTREAPNDAAAQDAAIQSLTLNEALGFCAYVGRRIQEFNDIFAKSAVNSNNAPVADFPDENALFAVKNKDNGELIGGVSVITETSTKYSTANAKNRTLVLDALDKAGVTSQYTKTTVELNNQKLLDDKNAGVLPASVSNLFSVSVTSKRKTSFQKLASETVED